MGMKQATTADINWFAGKYGATHLGKHNAQFGNVFGAGDFAKRLNEGGIKAELIEIDRYEWVVMW
jgi:hypothetical protein